MVNDPQTADNATPSQEKLHKALWIIREYIQDAIDTSDIESEAQINDCTTEIPVSDLRVVENCLAECKLNAPSQENMTKCRRDKCGTVVDYCSECPINFSALGIDQPATMRTVARLIVLDNTVIVYGLEPRAEVFFDNLIDAIAVALQSQNPTNSGINMFGQRNHKFHNDDDLKPLPQSEEVAKTISDDVDLAYLYRLLNKPFLHMSPAEDDGVKRQILSLHTRLRLSQPSNPQAIRDKALEDAVSVCINRNETFLATAIRAMKGKP